MSANIKWFDDDKNRHTTEVTVPDDLKGIGGGGYKSYDFPLTSILDIQIGESVITQEQNFNDYEESSTLNCIQGTYIIEKLPIEFDDSNNRISAGEDGVYLCTEYIAKNLDVLTLYNYDYARDTVYSFIAPYSQAYYADLAFSYATSIRWKITRITNNIG